jgi:hypothetical protein
MNKKDVLLYVEREREREREMHKQRKRVLNKENFGKN